MTRRDWQTILAVLGDEHWDESTELASMIADEYFPSVLDSDVRHELAAEIVVNLVRDGDVRRCVVALLGRDDDDYAEPNLMRDAVTREQWIISDGDHVTMPVGPFPTEEAAEEHYRTNQPLDTSPYLRRPVIERLLRPHDA